MQKISIYIALILITLMMGTSSVFAASEAPPTIIFDFEDEEDDAPPSLSIPGSSGSSSGTSSGSSSGTSSGSSSGVKPPTIPSINSDESPPKITFSFDPAADATLATNNASTNISKTGPETGYLIVASLILGYFANSYYKKVSAQKSLNDK